MSERKEMQVRSITSDLKTKKKMKCRRGYFAVFNRETELWPGAFEEIVQTFEIHWGMMLDVFKPCTIVLGRNKANTLNLNRISWIVGQGKNHQMTLITLTDMKE